jgi:outer membrane protein insertion porin family
MRQMEGGWYSTEKLKRSKQRIDKLGYFSEVSVDTVNVPGTTDEVDVEVKVVERPTGNLLFGVGYSTAEKVILSASISQANLFGTGNALSLAINSGSINKVYALSYTNPYFTDDGVSLGVDVYRRDVDAFNLNSVTPYSTSTLGTGLRMGVPITEYDTISYGLAVERTKVEVFPGSPPQYIDFVDIFGPVNTALIGTVGWSRDGRDSAIYTTSGVLQRVGFEAAVPPAELRYYRATYRIDFWNPIGREDVLQLSGQIGYASGYADLPLPFYKNYYLGGIGSVRGYYTSSIGPKDSLGNALGGPTMTAGSIEFYFPFPGLEKDKSVRLSVFVDAGQVSDNFDFGLTRFAGGLALSWYSPVGPIKISFARAINPRPEDRTQPFQFSLGTAF